MRCCLIYKVYHNPLLLSSWTDELSPTFKTAQGHLRLLCGNAPCLSQYDADQTACVFVDDLFECFTYLAARVIRHTAELVAQLLPHQLAERFAEDVRFPDLFGRVAELAEQIMHKLLGLFFRTDDRD